MRTPVQAFLTFLVGASVAALLAVAAAAQPPAGSDCEDIPIDPPISLFSTVAAWPLVSIEQDDGSEVQFFDVEAGQEIAAEPGRTIVRIFKCTSVVAPTPTESPTVTPEPTPTETPEPTPTETPESTPTPEPTPTATATPEPTPTASPEPTPTLAPAPTPTPAPQSVPPTPPPTSAPEPGTTPDAEVLGLQQERLAQTGAETPLLVTLGVVLLAFGAMVTTTARIARRPVD